MGIKGMRNDLQFAVDDFNEALRIREVAGSITTEGGAVLFEKLGVAKGQLLDKDGAYAAYKEAYDIRTAIETLDTPDGAHLTMNLALMVAGQGDMLGALGLITEAQR